MSSVQENILAKLIHEKACSHKDRVFLFFKDEEVTYRNLDTISNQFAQKFKALGIQENDKIAIMMNNHPIFLHVWFGTAKSGAVEVPINTAYKGELLKHIINNSNSKLLMIESSLLERLLIIKDELPELQQIICYGEIDENIKKEISIPISSIDEFFDCSTEPIEVELKPSDPCAIIYTSGTTGVSKGVVCSHNFFLSTARRVATLRQAGHQDILYTFLPLFHINAQLLTILAALVADAKVVLSDRFSASRFWDEIRKYGVTQFNYLGAVMTILAKQEPRKDDADNPVKIALGAACPPDVMKQLEERFGFVCLEGFGMSETGIVIHDDINARKTGSCGKVLDDIFEVQIVDDDDIEVENGETGEIVVRPKKPYIMMSEYYNMPDKTLEAFRNLWFHSGDYAKKDEEGYYYFVDRKKDAIRRRGENISSFEIEKIINSHPKVLESAVFAVPSELGEDEVKVNIVLKQSETLPPEDLIMFCNDRMAYFAIPRFIEFSEELPKTPTGRIEKYRLREKGITGNTWDREKAGVKISR
jgi:crotonobetaine/carnitine-CoA ligase